MYNMADFPGGPVVKTLPSNAGVLPLVEKLGAYMLCSQKTKVQNRNNTVINSIKTLKMVHIKKKKGFDVQLDS